MYYKMDVPIGFQHWPISRPQVDKFAELLLILWFWPPWMPFWALGCYFFCLFKNNYIIFWHSRLLTIYYKLNAPLSFQHWLICRPQVYIFSELLAILWFWPLQQELLALIALFFSLWGYIIFFGHYAVLEIYYTMSVPICFKVWPNFILQIYIFSELLAILWFWPLQRAFFGSCAQFFSIWG